MQNKKRHIVKWRECSPICEPILDAADFLAAVAATLTDEQETLKAIIERYVQIVIVSDLISSTLEKYKDKLGNYMTPEELQRFVKNTLDGVVEEISIDMSDLDGDSERFVN